MMNNMLDKRLKERLVGAIILVLLAVIFIPLLLQDEDEAGGDITETNIPVRPETEFNSRLVPLPDGAGQLNVQPPAPMRKIKTITPLTQPPVTEQAAARPAPAEPTKPLPQQAKETAAEPSLGKSPQQSPQQATKKSPQSTERPAEKSASAWPQADKGMTAWVVQVGSFSKRENAEKLNKKLREHNYRAFVQATESEAGVKAYKVRVGPEILRSSALQLKDNLEQQMSLPGMMMSYP